MKSKIGAALALLFLFNNNNVDAHKLSARHQLQNRGIFSKMIE